jgi:microcystin-dependent protein
MGRVQFVETVAVPTGPSGSLVPIAGIGTIPIFVNADGSEGSQAPAYAGRTGATTAPSLATDASGTVAYWLNSGDYNIHFQDQQSPARIAAYIRGFNADQGTTATTGGGTPASNAAIGDFKFSYQPGDHGGSAVPFDWLILVSDSVDLLGRKVLQSQYGSLWIALGSPTVDGQGYFRLPNVSGRTLVAAGRALNLTLRNRGDSYGEEGHTLSLAEMASHNHGGATGANSTGGESGHQHYTVNSAQEVVFATSWPMAASGANISPGAFPYLYPGNVSSPPAAQQASHTNTTSGAIGGHTHPIPALGIGADGGGAGHNNVQPSYGMNLFIKS